jgi:hypothetical protein
LDTVGSAEVTIDDTVNACQLKELTVIEEVVYDALFAASAAGYQIPIWSSAGATVNLSATTVNLVNTTTTVTNLHASAATAAELAKVPKSDSNVTWNSTALASIQSEANDALVANNLDHLVLSAVDTNFATTVHADSVIGQLADNGAGFDRTTDSLEAIRDRGDAAWTTGAAGATAADIADAVWDEATSGHTTSGTFGEQVKTDIDAILADTNELQTDWTDAGRLDNILDARASQTSVDDIPTNAELTAALGTADDAVLAAIAALNNLSQANIRTAVGLATANLDTQLGDLPTNAELTAALAAADDAVLTVVNAINTIVASGTHGNAALKTLIDTIDTVVDSILADTGTDGVVLSAATCNKIADHGRRRTQANVEASSDGDSPSVGSLYGFIQQVQEGSIAGATWTIYQTDGTTQLGTKAVGSTPSADPIISVS